MSQVNTKNQATKAADHSSAQLSAEMIKKLIEQSHEAKKQAYCPYSKFRVGSALLTADNRVFTGKEHDKLVCINSRVVGLTLTTRKRSWADPSIRCPDKYLYLLYCKSKKQQPNAISTAIRALFHYKVLGLLCSKVLMVFLLKLENPTLVGGL